MGPMGPPKTAPFQPSHRASRRSWKVHHAAGLCRCGGFVAKTSAAVESIVEKKLVFEDGNGASPFLTLYRLSFPKNQPE